MNDKERHITEHILRHCEEIMDTMKRFDFSKDKFMNDHVFYNACSMAVFQIGELSKRMPDSFKNAHPEFPWKEMRGMRNLFAHEYETMNKDMLWVTIKDDIPSLHRQFQKIYQTVDNFTNSEASDNHLTFYEQHSGNHIQNEALRQDWQKYLPRIAETVMRIATEQTREEVFAETMRKWLREKHSDEEVAKAFQEAGYGKKDDAPPPPPR